MPTRRRRDQIGALPDQETEFLQLEVETPEGLFLRTIRPAAFLPHEVDRGWAASYAPAKRLTAVGQRSIVELSRVPIGRIESHVESHAADTPLPYFGSPPVTHE